MITFLSFITFIVLVFMFMPMLNIDIAMWIQFKLDELQRWIRDMEEWLDDQDEK